MTTTIQNAPTVIAADVVKKSNGGEYVILWQPSVVGLYQLVITLQQFQPKLVEIKVQGTN
jgi:hypothetical protein